MATPVYNPTGPRAGYVTPTKATRKKPYNPALGAGQVAPWATGTGGTGWGTQAGGTAWGLQPGERGVAGQNGDFITDWLPGGGAPNAPGGDILGPIGGAVTPGAGGGRRSITFGGEPAYRGILDRYTANWRAQLNAALGAMRQNTLSGQRGLINRLGVRDPAKMLAAIQARGVTGITAEDLQQAAENPFSDLMALDKRTRGSRATLGANLGQRGGIRSGAATKGVTDIENERARAEALATEEALTGIGSAQSQLDTWGREQEADLFNRSADLEQQLAQMYQPRTAFWDDQYGGYVHGGYVYDQNGNIIGTV